MATFGGLSVNQVGTYTPRRDERGPDRRHERDLPDHPGAPDRHGEQTGPRPTARRSPSPAPSSRPAGLLGPDTVTSVTLTSAGAAADRDRRRQPLPDHALGRRRLGPRELHDQLRGRQPHGQPGRPDRSPPTNRTKTYGQTVVFAGTEFTTSGLLNADTVTSVTLDEPGAAATATVAGSPYPITPSAAVGTGLANYTISLRDGQPDGQRRALTDHRQRPDQDLRPDGHLRRHRVHRPPASRQRRHRTSVTLTSPGAAPTATVAGSPYADHAVGGRRHRASATTRSPTSPAASRSTRPR